MVWMEGQGTVAPVELLERSAELDALRELYDEVATTDRGRLVLVRGEAGAGERALVGRFCGDPVGRGLEGAWGPLFPPRPLGPFLDIARLTGGELARVAATAPRPY